MNREKLDAMAKPRSKEAIAKAEERKASRKITEDYCSKEVVQMLREKGFPVGVGSWSKGFVYDGEGYVSGLVKHEDSITHQTAMKWLREVHGYCIEPYVLARSKYAYAICSCNDGLEKFSEGYYINNSFDTYEEAVEAALKYVLENLLT